MTESTAVAAIKDNAWEPVLKYPGKRRYADKWGCKAQEGWYRGLARPYMG